MMSTRTVRNGWERLPNGFDVEFRHDIPVRLSDNGRGLTVPEEVLLEEVTALGKLHVSLGNWEAGERDGEHEARLYVVGGEFSEVLRRLARASAALFVERYHKPVGDADVDWDRLEFLKDFEAALECCRLSERDVDRKSCLDDYLEIMHSETRRLARTGDVPPVEPE
jgi:hypothetical protein